MSAYLISYLIENGGKVESVQVEGGEPNQFKIIGGFKGFRHEEFESRASAESRKSLYSQEVPPRFAEVVEHEGDLAVLTRKSITIIYNGLGAVLKEEADKALADNVTIMQEEGTETQTVVGDMSDGLRKVFETAAAFKPVKSFKNVELGQKKLFAMIVGGGKEEPSAADQAPPAGQVSRGAVIKENEKMATKTAKKAAKKKAAKKTASAPRVVAPLTAPLAAGNAPTAGMTSGCYIRSLIMLKVDTPDILKLVHKHFKGSTAKGSDISWNRAKLRAAGKVIPEPKKAAE